MKYESIVYFIIYEHIGHMKSLNIFPVTIEKFMYLWISFHLEIWLIFVLKLKKVYFHAKYLGICDTQISVDSTLKNESWYKLIIKIEDIFTKLVRLWVSHYSWRIVGIYLKTIYYRTGCSRPAITQKVLFSGDRF